jgi:hypothetical protein
LNPQPPDYKSGEEILEVTENKALTLPPHSTDSIGAEWDAELVALIDAWPNIPPAIRAGITAMVNAST